MDEKFSPPCVKSTSMEAASISRFGAIAWQPMPHQPPLLRPHDDFDSWEFQVSVYLTTVGHDKAGPFLLSFLSEEASKIVRNAGVSANTPAEEIRTTLRRLFARSEPPAFWKELLVSRKQLPGEPVDDFSWAIMDLVAKAYPSNTQDEREEATREWFCRGLSDTNLRTKFVYKPARTLTEALEKARRSSYIAADATRSDAALAHCIALKENPRQTGSTEPGEPDENCKYCAQFGRLAQYCGHNPPIRREELQGRHKSVPIHCVSSTVCNTTTNVVRLLTSNGLLGSIRVQFLIDTGASCSLVNENIANESGGSIIRSTSRGIFMADGSDLATRGELTARLTVQDRTFDHRFFVCRGLKWDAILGMDFLSAHCQNIQISTGRMSFKEAVVKNQSVQRQSVNATLYACNDREFQTEVIEGIKSNADVTLSQKSALIATLESYRGVFASTEGTPGRTDVIHHEIDTGDHRPIKQRPRRLPIHYVPQLDEMINNMLTKDVIRPSSSPWSSPIVLVKKKDGSLRLCVDYRKLNEITRKDSFPLPRIDATFDALHGAEWFTTLDLASGYWQVEIKPSDCEKTAFSVPSGLYEFQTMPFGLANAPATFQRLMENVLRGMVPEKCLIYMDDIIVHGKTVDEHNERLREVLERLNEAGLKLKGTKCNFLHREVQFLGHVITTKGIMTDPAKCDRIVNWPQPQSLDQLRSFLGLASYYRKFVQGFASLAAPLHRLTTQGRNFSWSPECDIAFTQLKAALASPPVLALPDTSCDALPFILDTDASDLAIGAVLSQKTDKGEVVIAYASRRLDPPERKYSTTRKELLALVYFINQFRPYLLGKPFKVRTDHHSLQWLRSFKDAEGQVARWQEKLAEYDFTCEHRPGLRHSNADALSRFPYEVNAALAVPEETQWADEQEHDPYIARIYSCLKGDGRKPSGREMRASTSDEKALWGLWSQLEFINGVMYQRTRTGAKLVVPRSKSDVITQRIHEQLGHSGQLKTEAAIRRCYWWPTLHPDVVNFCRNCATCAAIKDSVPATRAPLEPMATGEPSHRVGIDIMGPLPMTRNGNRYILVMIDYFTKWVEASPIRFQDAKTVANVFTQEWVSRYGAPLNLHSDQGAAFESQLLQEVSRLLGVKKSRTTPYHPQGNGLVERTNRTIKSLLQGFIENAATDCWDEVLPLCLMAYRASYHSTTKFSPAFLTLGREIRLPAELLTPSTTNNETTTEYTRALQKRIYEAFDQVKRNSNCARKQQKRQYDRKVCGPTYAVGDRVLLYRPRPPPGSASKFYRRWQGPYDVVFIRSPTVYVIRRMGGRNGEVLTVHYNHLKPLRRVQSDEQEDLELIPPGCLPIVEDTVEVAPEGGPGVPQRYPGTGDSAIQGREQCNSSEEVPGRFECARL